MTRIYDWNPSPDEISIRCPACGAEAIFEFAFTPLTGFTTPPGMGRLPRNPKAYATDEGGFRALVNTPISFRGNRPIRAMAITSTSWAYVLAQSAGIGKSMSSTGRRRRISFAR
jgi:hypothetical protein